MQNSKINRNSTAFLAILWLIFPIFYTAEAGELASAASKATYLKASNAEAGDYFAYSVAIDGNTVVIGAILESSDAVGVNGDEGNNLSRYSGAVYVFVKEEQGWRQQAYLKASNTGSDDWFGTRVDISGNTIVVGAPLEDSRATGINGNGLDNTMPQSGAAYVFVREGENWTQQAYLKASNTNAGDLFGGRVAISGDTIVASAEGEDSNATGVNGNGANNLSDLSGAAYVFVREGETWAQQAYLKGSDSGNSVQFGSSVDVDGDTIVVGVPFDDAKPEETVGENDSFQNSGAVHVFTREGSEWTQQAYLKAFNADESDLFGHSVGVDDDTIVIGATGEASATRRVNGNSEDNSAPNSGAVYVYVKTPTGWAHQAYLKTWNAEAGDSFGQDVSVSGNIITAGSVGESSNSRGLNEDGRNNLAPGSGAAYVFARDESGWRQRIYRKASNADINDWFGGAVDTDGVTLVVGAYAEQSGSVGIDGDDSDNSASYCGAAYVYPIGELPLFRSAPFVSTVKRSQIRTIRSRYTLTGTSADAEDDLSHVTITGAGKSHMYPLSSGETTWRHVVRLKRGLNRVKVSVFDFSGLKSKTVRLNIIRRT